MLFEAVYAFENQSLSLEKNVMAFPHQMLIHFNLEPFSHKEETKVKTKPNSL